MKLNGVMLNSENSSILGDFYTKILGEPGWKDDGWYGFDVGGGMMMIGGHSDVKGKNTDAPRIMLSFTVDDVKAEFGRIKGLGAKVVAEPYQPDKDGQPDIWLATLADPDGNYLQLSLPWPN